MEELNDKDFDQIFKNKITNSYLDYEEDSWIKMEKKLRKRDRFVFFRNASIILLFLSFGIGFGLYFAGDKTTEVKDVKASNKTKRPALEITNPVADDTIILAKKNTLAVNIPQLIQPSSRPLSAQLTMVDSIALTVPAQIAQNSVSPEIEPTATPFVRENAVTTTSEVAKVKSKLPISIAFIVGPDFNSTKTTIGGKSGIAMGIALSVGLTKRLSVQTGLIYGAKNYDAESYDYTFNNPAVVNTIAGINASCKVIEIPLRASYTLTDNQKNSIHINTGLSSYLMLKENYRFIYTAASGRKDRFLEEKNANQHYLSVIDLSATYNIKLKNKNFALGLEPYVKIPLGGIGAGNVPLKSSGISLKLNYELNKKQ